MNIFIILPMPPEEFAEDWDPMYIFIAITAALLTVLCLSALGSCEYIR